MSDCFGFVVFGCQNGNMFLGRDIMFECDFFEEIVVVIDDEVSNLVD